MTLRESTTVVLDYATPEPESLRARYRRWARRSGPWVFPPSPMTLAALLVVLLAALLFHHRQRAWRRVATMPASVDRLEVTAQGKLLYIDPVNGPRLIDPYGGPDTPLRSADFSAAQITSDGRFIYTLGDELRVWDAATGGMIATPPRWKWEPDNPGSLRFPRPVDFDGKRLVEFPGAGEVVVWNMTDLAHPRVAARTGGPKPHFAARIALSLNARDVLIVNGGDEVSLLSGDTLMERWRQKPSAGQRIVARVSPDGRTLVVIEGARMKRHSVRLINLDDLTERGTAEFWALEFMIAFDPRSGNLLITEFSGAVDSVFDINTGKPVLPWPYPRDGLVLAQGVRKPFASFDPFGGRELSPLRDYEQVIAFPDRRHVATWQRSRVEIWRGNPEASSDPPVLHEPTFWLLGIAGCMLPWSVFRGSAFRGRRRIAATALATTGTAALTITLAQTSLAHDIDPSAWLRTTLPMDLMLACLVLAHGLARGGVGWLWTSRALLLASLAVAGWLAGATNLPALYEVLDMAWRPVRWQLVTLAFAWGIVVVGCVAMLHGVQSTPPSGDA